MSHTDQAVLLLGGTGKVASLIAPLLYRARIPVLLASRSGDAVEGYHGVHFDWEDAQTYENPWKEAPSIKAVFIVCPPAVDVLPIVQPFVELARAKGVTRFVLLSASSIPEGGLAMGTVHAYLKTLNMEWAVLQPTWFMQNLSDPKLQHLETIRDQSELFSATGDGKISWISCDDIAEVAYHALTDSTSHNTEHLILGPEYLSYGDLANIISTTVGRKITHVNLSSEELVARLSNVGGLPEEFARILASMDEGIKAGMEARPNDTVLRITGHEPRRFKDFAAEKKTFWIPKDFHW